MAEEKLPKKAAKKINKLLIGMVIGGAIGSVVGATMTNNTGKENREILKQKSQELLQKSKDLLGPCCEEKKCQKKTFWHILNHLLFSKKNDQE